MERNKVTDPLHKSGADHPCKGTCSGWQQGFDRGVDHVISIERKLNDRIIIATGFIESYINRMKLGNHVSIKEFKDVLEKIK